jgi:hypothetical protein
MRLRLALALLTAMTTSALTNSALTNSALAEGFEIVVPGRPGVPIIVNGVDVSYAVLEGNYGLGKGVNNQPTIYGGRLVPPEPNVGHYYPSLGLKPAYGRLEIEPPANRRLPQPAESYHDSWSAQSAPNPPNLQPPLPEVPFYPPPVIMAPPGGGDDHMRHDFSGPPQDFRRKPQRLPN